MLSSGASLGAIELLAELKLLSYLLPVHDSYLAAAKRYQPPSTAVPLASACHAIFWWPFSDAADLPCFHLAIV